LERAKKKKLRRELANAGSQCKIDNEINKEKSIKNRNKDI